jgi:signal recognition particle subunit SEC65
MEPDNLTYILETLAKKAQITTTGRVRWHCLRKFGITTIHGKVEDPVLRYMTGKKIDKSLRVYIQKNNEPFKAFKLVEPLISLSKSNGGSSTLSKQLEELKETTFKQMALMKLLEKVVGKKEMEKAIMALAKEFGIEIKVHEFVGYPKRGKPVKIKMPIVKLEDFVSELGKKIEKQELERILNENGNGE